MTSQEIQFILDQFRPLLEGQLRDRIATEAMGQLMADLSQAGLIPSDEAEGMRELAAQAYRMADAMMTARAVYHVEGLES